MNKKDKRKRLLILTLGSGSIIDRATKKEHQDETRESIITELVHTKKYVYRETDYFTEIGGETHEFKEEAFVASPIVQLFKPDEVIVIGTIRSSWASFLSRFHKAEIDETDLIRNLCELDNLESRFGIETTVAQLNDCQKKINAIIQKVIDDTLFPNISIVLTRYGINEKQLEQNYMRIKEALSDGLSRDTGYDIAFDITHSFRSMPIYNLVLLNYLRYISDYDLRITHVYYGNYEIKSEMDDKAALVDLSSITNILDLTNGVSEFKKTGNAATILDIISSDSELYQALLEFDRSIQLNDFDGIVRSVRDLSVCFSDKANRKKPGMQVEDAERIIEKAIKKSILYGKDLKEFVEIGTDWRLQRDMRYYLAIWFWEQGRYGQASVVGMEALRSMLAPYYLEKANVKVDAVACSREVYRQGSIENISHAINYWDRRKNSIKKNEHKMIKLLSDLEMAVLETRSTRNMFAHVLRSETIGEEYEKLTVDDKVRQVDRFFDVISDLYSIVADNDEVFRKIYTCKGGDKPAEEKKKNERVRLLITDVMKIDQAKSETVGMSVNRNKKSTIYTVPAKLRSSLRKNKSDKLTDYITKDAIAIREYIEEFFSDAVEENRFAVIFDDSLAENQKMIIGMAIIQMNDSLPVILMKDFSVKPYSIPKMGLQLDEEFEIDYKRTREYQDIIEEEPVFVYSGKYKAKELDEETDTEISKDRDRAVRQEIAESDGDNNVAGGEAAAIYFTADPDEDVAILKSKPANAAGIIGAGCSMVVYPQSARKMIKTASVAEKANSIREFASELSGKYDVSKSIILINGKTIILDDINLIKTIFAKKGAQKCYIYLGSGWKGPFLLK